MIAFEIYEKICFFALFHAFLEKFFVNILAFLQGLYLASSTFKDYTKSFTIGLGLGKTMLWQENAIWDKKGHLKKVIF